MIPEAPDGYVELLTQLNQTLRDMRTASLDFDEFVRTGVDTEADPAHWVELLISQARLGFKLAGKEPSAEFEEYAARSGDVRSAVQAVRADRVLNSTRWAEIRELVIEWPKVLMELPSVRLDHVNPPDGRQYGE